MFSATKWGSVTRLDFCALKFLKRRSNVPQWLASDAWGRQRKLVEGLEEEAEGAITVELQSENIPGFDSYMESLTPENNRRNPWFGEYWEEVFGCTLRKNVVTYERFSLGSRASTATTTINQSICPSSLRLSTESGYEQESKVQFVVDAVYAFAFALSKLRRDLCGRVEGMCSSMANYDRGAFYKNYLLNVSFVGESDDGARRPAHKTGSGTRTIVTARHAVCSPLLYHFFFHPSLRQRSSYPLPFRSKGEELPGREGGRRGIAKEMFDETTLNGIIGEAIDLRELKTLGFCQK